MLTRATASFLAATLLITASVQAQTDPVSKGDIMITEILYSSDASDTDREYIELYNTTSDAVNLEDWRLIGEDPATANPSADVIDESIELEAGEFAVLCENGTVAENGGVQCAFDYVNSINHENTSDLVVIENADGKEIDRVRYNEDNGWPNAVGASLEYVAAPGESNNDASNWEAATVRSGDFGQSTGADYGSPNADAPEGALPVEFAAFEIDRQSDRVLLQWTTAFESGNAGFEVQHRLEGAETWRKCTFVKGQGTTDKPHSYRYRSRTLKAGVHAFRLKQVDLDGSSSYSASRLVEIPRVERLMLHGPNPVRSGESLSVTVGSTAGTDKLLLYNVLGQRVRSIPLSSVVGARPRRVDLPIGNLSSGTYFVRTGGVTSKSVRRFTVVK